jgi:hypothetical protein
MWWLAALLVPVAFVVWIAGHFVRAKREARASLLRTGTPASAEVTRVRGRRVDYAFDVPGWPEKVAGSGNLPAGQALQVGDRVPVRYLARHPHVSTLDAGAQTRG